MDTKYYSKEGTDCVYETETDKSSPESLICQYPSSATLITTRSTSRNESNTVYQPPFYFYNRNEIDRLVSDQGLITPRQRTRSNRKVRDKSYYKGLIYLKCREIRNEINKFQKEIGLLTIDYHTYLPYKKKAEAKAMDLKDLQNVLANYNFVDDMLIRGTELLEAMKKLENIKAQNNMEDCEVEKLFEIRKKKEATIREIETDLSQESHINEILTTTANPKLRKKFIKLKQMNDEIVTTRTEQEKELENLKEQFCMLKNKCNESKLSKELFQGLSQLKRLERERDVLISEKTFMNSSEEKEHLQNQYVEDNYLLKAIVIETQNLKNNIRVITDEIKKTETEAFYSKGERSRKYLKLRKKETMIEDFLGDCHNQYLSLFSEQKELESKIHCLLQNISKELHYFIPTRTILEDNFSGNSSVCNSNKIDETEETLKSQFLKSALSLYEIECLEQKVEDERKDLTGEIGRKEEVLMFQHTDYFEAEIQKRKHDLYMTLNQVQKQLKASKFINEDLNEHYKFLKQKLEHNETFHVLSKLEQRWHSLEQENISMMDFIVSNKPETSYLPIKENVKKILQDLNQML